MIRWKPVGVVLLGVAGFCIQPAAAAASCHQLAGLNAVKSYSGTASTSYVSGTLVGPPPPALGADGATLSVDRSATNLQISDLRHGAVQGADFGSSTQPTGGSVTVNDSYADPTTEDNTQQTASGPTKSGGDGNGIQILTNGAKCTYQVLVSFAIGTTTTGTAGDSGVADNATSPSEPIPANLVLKGSAAIPASGGGGTSGTTGLFDMSGDPQYGFWLDYVTTGAPTGGAKVSWDLTPAVAKAGCVVPKLAGLKQRSAQAKLTAAGCKVGKVSKASSSKVAKGKVISSRPKAGTKLQAGAKVAVVVSTGKKK